MKRLLALLVAVIALPAAASDIDVVRKNFIDYYTAGGADRSTEAMQSALANLESSARSVTAPGFLLSDGTWSDINYNDTPDGAWSPWDHTRRLIIMARAYRTPGQALYRDPQLLVQIESALKQVNDYYGVTTLPLGNWWFWTLGVPLDLGPTLVLMRGDITQKTYDDLVATLAFHIRSSPTGRGIVGPVPTGENLVWSSYTHLCLGLLQDDPTMLAKVRDAMATVTLPSSGEGMKQDGSFHQHGAQLYNGGYGGSFAADVSRYALFARGTAYQLPQQSLDAFSDYVADGIAWTIQGKYFDVSVVGREVSRRSTTGFNGITALLQSSQFESRRSAEIRSAAMRMMQAWEWGYPTELAGIAAILQRSGYPAAWPSGHRHYYQSDYTVHRRAAWYASIKMFSTRTKSGESTNDENVHGSRESDGRFYLAFSGDEYFGRDIWPAIDWTRLPGITVEQSLTAADDTYGYGTKSLAGGTGDGRNGVSAMDLAPLGASLTAKKSWFFFDDAIVFLTNSITDTTPYRVETVVNNWPLMNAGATFTREGNWAHAENVGYMFPSGGNLQTKRETRTGTWAALGGSDDTTLYSATFLTLWFDHGASPRNASAEYIIVPNVSANQMRAWAASNAISILANNSVVSAARDNRTGATGVVFWSAGSFDGITSDGPAVIYLNGTNVSIADPTSGTSGNRTINVRGTIVTAPRNGGQTYTAKVPLPDGRRRAVR